MPKISIDYSVSGTVSVEMTDKSLESLKESIKDYKDIGLGKRTIIEERFAEEISQHIKNIASVEIEDWEIEE